MGNSYRLRRGNAAHAKGKRKGFDDDGGVQCRGCFEAKLKHEELRAEIVRLKAALAQAQRTKKKDIIGAHVPSSRIEHKANTKEDLRTKKGGAQVGHTGHGRSSLKASDAGDVRAARHCGMCADCEVELNAKDTRERTVIESDPVIAKRVVYRCERGICPKCFRVYPARVPALAKSLYGNSVIAQAVVMHYMHGVPIGRVISIMGEEVTLGGLHEAFHRLGRMAEKVKVGLITDYRRAGVKHADETGWRTDGHSGYAWLFTSECSSIFEFRDSRASRIAMEILGQEKLAGILVVDRYKGYHRMPIAQQYCYAHLLRDVAKLEEEFSGDKEVTDFCGLMSAELTKAMKVRGLELSPEQFLQHATEIKNKIELIVEDTRYRHLGIKRIQEIFIDQRERLYHWAQSRDVPADNNRAERELRPTVIARKVSFGSQSDAGAKTRGLIMSMLYSAKKRLKDKSVEEWLRGALDEIAFNPQRTLEEMMPPVQSTPRN